MSTGQRHGGESWSRSRRWSWGWWICVVALVVGRGSLPPAAGATQSFVVSGQSVSFEEVTSQVEVHYSAMRWNRARQIWQSEVTIRNSGDRALSGRLLLAVVGMTGTSGVRETDNAPNAPVEEPPFLNFSATLDQGTLAKGAATRPRLISLGRLGDDAPRLITRVFVESGPAVALALAVTRTLDGEGQPLPGVEILEQGPAGESWGSSDRGAGVATLGGTPGRHRWRFSQSGYFPAWRQADLAAGVVRLPDPRLVARQGTTFELGPTSTTQEITAEIRVENRAGTSPTRRAGTITVLGPQTLPAPLPVGWSPEQASWLEWEGTLAQPLRLNVLPRDTLPAKIRLVVVRFDTNALAWVTLRVAAREAGAAMAVDADRPGAYAVVVPDGPPTAPPEPRIGEALAASPAKGTEFSSLTVEGDVRPSVSLASTNATEVTAQAHLRAESPGGTLPSGTAVPVRISERYQLSNGSRLEPAPYDTVVFLYRQAGETNASLAFAEFPLRPLLLLRGAELTRAVVDAQVQSPAAFTGGILGPTRPPLRTNGWKFSAGSVAWRGPRAVQVESLEVTAESSSGSQGGSRLAGWMRRGNAEASGSAGQEATSNGAEMVSSFAITAGLASPEERIEFRFETDPGDGVYVLARAWYRGAQAGLEPVALYESRGGQWVTLEGAGAGGMTGLDRSGQYAVWRVSGRPGVLTGTVRDALGGPRSGEPVSLANQPWGVLTDAQGRFRTLMAVGKDTVLLTGSAAAGLIRRAVVMPEERSLDLGEIVTAESAPFLVSTSPADGSLNVGLLTPVVVQFSKPVIPAPALDSLVLRDMQSNAVPSRVSLDPDGRAVRLIPSNLLSAATAYRVTVPADWTDATGRRIEGNRELRFTTVSNVVERSVGAQLFSEPPDAQGLVRIVGSVGMAPPRRPVIFVNDTTGQTATLDANGDGSFTNRLVASLTDRLRIVLVNQDGSRAEIPVARQVFPDGSVALYSEGGRITNRNAELSVVLEVSPGAVLGRTRFKLEPRTRAEIFALTSNTAPIEATGLGAFDLTVEGDPVRGKLRVEVRLDRSGLTPPPGKTLDDFTLFDAAFRPLVDPGQGGETTVPVFQYQSRLLPLENANGTARALHDPHALFAGYYAMLDPIGARHLLFGSVYYSQTEIFGSTASALFLGGRQVIPGTEVRVGGAVVRARARATLNQRPFSLQAGEVVVISEADGTFAFLVPEQGISGGHATIATHPNFPRQFAVGADTGVRVDPLYPNAAGQILFDRSRRPDQAPPRLTILHEPPLPAAGSDAIVRVEVVDDGGPATATLRVDHVDPTSAVVSANETQPGIWRVSCSARAKVVLNLRGEDSSGNAQEEAYVILFGEPPVPPRPPNDPLGPHVTSSDPDVNALGVSLLRPITLRFSEWIDPRMLASPGPYFTLTPSAGIPVVSVGVDPSELHVAYGDLRDNTEYTLTVQGLRDLTGQVLDQNPATNSPPAESFQLRFRTAPVVQGQLPGIDEGGGAVALGAYAYVLDRRGMTVNRYDLSIPGEPVLSGQRSLPGPPRALALVRDYSFTLDFASPGQPSDRPGAVRKSNLLVVAGRTSGASFGYLRVYDLQQDFERSGAIGVGLLSLDETAQFGRMTWSAPYLLLPENSLAAPQVHVFNLQAVLLADAYRNLDQGALLGLPVASVPGVDANNDGDFVDANDRLPLVGRDAIDFVAGEVDLLSLNPNRRGPNGQYQLRSSSRFITDVAVAGRSAHAIVATGPGTDVLVEVDGYPVVTNRLVRDTTVRSYRIGSVSPDTLVPEVVTNTFALSYPGWYPKRALFLETDLRRLLILNLVALDNSSSAVRVIDASRADHLTDLNEIALPLAEYGLLQGAELDGLGRLVLSTARANGEDLIVLDPKRLLLPTPASGPHQAILGRLGGLGNGVTPFVVGANGVSVGSLRSRNFVGQGAPLLRFLPPGRNTFEALRLLDPEARLAALRQLPDPTDLPVTGQGTNATLPAGSPEFAWYLMAEAPGGAGREIQLAVVSLAADGQPVQGTNSTLRNHVPDLVLHRLSDDPLSDAYSAFVSGPLVLMPDATPEADVQRLVNQYEVLRAGVRVRIGIPEAMAGNQVLGPFAGSGTFQASPPANAPPVRLGVGQARPVRVTTPELTVDDPILLRTAVDRLNQRACPGTDWLYFEHNLNAEVTITVDGNPLRDVYDENGNLVAEFSRVPSVAGRHRLLLDAARVPAPGDHAVEVTATRFAGLDPNRSLTARATIQHEIEMHQSFPIGHTIIQGVDLWDGHLGHSGQDVHLAGRKLSLTFGRTYSSAGDASGGPLGAGWTHSYHIRLVHRIDCGVFTVIGGEGSGNSFTDPAADPLQAAAYLPLLPTGVQAADLEFLRPQIGYHSVLVRDRQRPDTFWFFTKEGLRHDFVAEGSLSRSPQTVFTLRLIREPNGNALGFDYLAGDQDPATLDTVTELDALGALPKRGLRLAYDQIAGEKRLTTLRGFNHQGSPDLLGLEVRYAYDGEGNLTNVTRLGPTPVETRTEQFRYTGGNGPTGHNLLEYVGPNGMTTRYRYASSAGPGTNYYASGANLLPGLPAHEIVTNVTHLGAARPGFEATTDQSYGLRFDFTNARRYVAEPRTQDSDGQAIPETEYTVNSYGATVRVRAPLGQESEMRWATDHLDGSVRDAAGQPVHDVLMTWRRDPEGQEQFFEYHDGRGNLTRQRTVFTGSSKRPVTEAAGQPVPEIEQRFAYDGVFNQTTNSVDAEGNATLHFIDPRNGNLLRTVEAQGYVTRYAYHANGELRERVDARGFTTLFVEYDPYGNLRRTRDPLGNETLTTYDERGRLIESRDGLTHHTRAWFDALDRTVSEVRLNDLSGLGTGPDAWTGARFDAAGLVLESTNSLGLVTRHFYDALNREVRSELVDVRQSQGPPQTHISRVGYDRAGNLITETDARGVTRSHFYDALNRRVRTRVDGPFGGPFNGSGIVAQLAYDRAGNLTNQIDLHGGETRYLHDALYRPVETQLPLPGAALVARFDRVGNKTRITDAQGFPATMEYDRAYRVKRSVDAEGRVKEFAYDAANNLTNAVDRTSGLVTRTVYDAANREVERVLTGPGLPPAGVVTRTEYRDARNEVEIRNPRGFATRARKDGLDRLAEKVIDVGGLNLLTRATYDAAGHALTTSDAEGGDVDVSQEYDQLGRMLRRNFVATPDDAGAVTESFTYDATGNLIGTIDRRGFERRGRFDNLQRPVSLELREPISGAGGWRTVSSSSYDDARRQIAITDARGNVTTEWHDPLGRLRQSVDALGQTQTIENGPLGMLAKVDGKGQRTAFTYDRLNRLRTVSEFDTNQILRTGTSVEYRDAQRQVVSTDRRGLVQITEHDALGRPIQTQRSGPDLAARYGANPLLLERREYDANGNLLRLTDGNGHITEYAYDGADRLTNVVEAVGTAVAASTATRYDRVGNVVTVKDARAHGGAFDVRHEYDARYRRVATENALGQKSRFRYDAGDRLVELTEPLGYVTRYEYDEVGALLAVDESARATAGDAGITRFRYDAGGNLVAQQDANGNLVTKAYDALNRLTNSASHTLPGNLGATVTRTGPFGGGAPLSWSFGYDRNGNQSLRIDPRGQRVDLDFDHLDRLARRTYSGHAEKAPTGLPRDFQPLQIDSIYDGSGNLIEVRESKQWGTGSITEKTVYEYDGLDRLAKKTRFDHDDPVGRPLEFRYDLAGNRTNLVDPDGRVTAAEFDARNRLALVALEPASPGALRTTFAWEPDGLLRRVEYPGGTFTTRNYDPTDRLLGLTNATVGSAFAHSTYQYAYDANGNRTNQIEVQPGAGFGAETTTYSYDKLNRLATVHYGVAASITTTYAPNGNRLTEQGTDPVTGAPVDRVYRYEAIPGRTATTYDGVNVLTRIEDHLTPARSIDYDYDANLNQIARTQGADARQFRYDVQDQLIAATVGGSTSRFDYNAERRRVKKLAGAGLETRYLYDQSSVLIEYGPMASGLATRHKYDYGHALLAYGTPGAPGSVTLDRQFYLTDGLQSTVGLVGPTGTLKQQYRYDAWGRVRVLSGTNDNPRQFTGHFHDAETGLHYFGARYYDDEQARFISADPNPGEAANPPSLNRYLYANANPLRFSDPTGYAAKSGDPTDRWIAETREMLQGMDQRLEADIAKLGGGALETYRQGQKAAGELQRMGEERVRLLQEAGLTEGDLRNPVMADRAKWGMALLKRDLGNWVAAGDGGVVRPLIAAAIDTAATLASAPLEVGAGLGTVAGKLDVGAQVTTSEWIQAGGDVLSIAGTLGTAGRIGASALARRSAEQAATQLARGAVIAEARRTIGREVGAAARLLDNVPARAAAEREFLQISRAMDESARELSLLRRANTRLSEIHPYGYNEARSSVGALSSPHKLDPELADFYVNQMLRDHGPDLVRIDRLTREVAESVRRGRNLDDALRPLSEQMPFRVSSAKELPADLPGFGKSPFTGEGRGGYNAVRYSESERGLFVDADLISAMRQGDVAMGRRFAGEFLHDSAAVPLIERYGKSRIPVVVYDNIIQVPKEGFRRMGDHLTHYMDRALDRYLQAHRALHP